MQTSNKSIHIVTGIAIACGMSIGSASAADLNSTIPIISHTPATTWDGFYTGAFAGWGWSNDDAKTTGTTSFQNLGPTIIPNSLSLSQRGFTGGITAGYNKQSGNIVYGLEGDLAYLDFDETKSSTGVAVLGTRLETQVQHELQFFGTLRGRLGYSLNERFMVFATGGLAFGQVNYKTSVNGVDAPNLNWSGDDKGLKFGWTLGGGGEMMLTDALSIKVDGLYYDLANSKATATGNSAVRSIGALNGIDYQSEVDNTGGLLRVGVNYRF